MQKHTKNYYKHFGYDESDLIFCEWPKCGWAAVDIHHVEPRSKFGSKRKDEQDDVSNLVALCRNHHDMAHGPEGREVKEKLKQIVKNRKR